MAELVAANLPLVRGAVESVTERPAEDAPDDAVASGVRGLIIAIRTPPRASVSSPGDLRAHFLSEILLGVTHAVFGDMDDSSVEQEDSRLA